MEHSFDGKSKFFEIAKNGEPHGCWVQFVKATNDPKEFWNLGNPLAPLRSC